MRWICQKEPFVLFGILYRFVLKVLGIRSWTSQLTILCFLTVLWLNAFLLSTFYDHVTVLKNQPLHLGVIFLKSEISSFPNQNPGFLLSISQLTKFLPPYKLTYPQLNFSGVIFWIEQQISCSNMETLSSREQHSPLDRIHEEKVASLGPEKRLNRIEN